MTLTNDTTDRQARAAVAASAQFMHGCAYNSGSVPVEPFVLQSFYMNTSDDDETLMLRFQQAGDYAAFEQLFLRHKDAFVTFLLRLSGNLTIAEDISQIVWVKLMDVAQKSGYKAKASFKTYLYTLGRNRYIDEYHRKHEATRTQSLGDDEQTFDSAFTERGHPETIATHDERTQLVNSAISMLPLEQRDVVTMWASGMGFNLISEITQAPRDTVISRKKYGIKRLRIALEAAGIGEGTL